ncbi:sensor histidine kinase [Frigoriglobus tundricola]|uniref:histidine kinase n=1 Tax=Frigoriglobus tundricola TaxID=2774151 RepID=A0A6M5Z7K3_9BACT|nr:ATP-binding protein [Frigoriglobus tundricola]QJX01203.1 Two-component system sensor histidine kinase [Frigoriglobus tundricola]
MDAELGLDTSVDTPLLRRICRYLSERSPQPTVAVEGLTHVVIYVNPAFARFVGRERKDLVGRPFAETVPESEGNGCQALLDRVFRTGLHETLAEQEHRHTQSVPVYWSYAVWAILGADERPAGVMIQVTDATETAVFRSQAAAVNEALVLSSVRQHELMEETGALNARLREAQHLLEGRVAERTGELAAANAALQAEIGSRETAEVDRRELLRLLATAQEDERRRIARDLHDQMGQLVTALGLGLKTLEATTPDPSPARLQLPQLRELTDRIGREVHQLARDLRPTALDDLGLLTALSNYADDWAERSGIEIDFQSVGWGTGRLPQAVETALYRVVQETLTNVIRHSGARRVSLVLQLSPGLVTAVVEDDGVGFDAESVAAPAWAGGRVGLLGIRERLTLLGGTLVIESVPGRGTTVIARVPLPTRGTEDREG